jgi:hypothetical protein
MRRLGLALAAMGLGLASVGLVACSGDDTDIPLPDAGGDATIASDGSSGDATTSSDAGVDTGADANVDANAVDGGATCTPFDAGTYSDAEIQSGLAIVVARKCEGCHGEQLQGNANGLPSTQADGGMAYPPDLTPDPVNGLGCWTNAEIERAFLYGVDKNGLPLCNPMPQFGNEGSSSIDDAGAAAVVAYLRSIPIVVNPHVPKTPACYPVAVVDAGTDAGVDAGADAGADSGFDAGLDATASAEAGPGAQDAGDAGAEDASDAGAEDASDDGG